MGSFRRLLPLIVLVCTAACADPSPGAVTKTKSSTSGTTAVGDTATIEYRMRDMSLSTENHRIYDLTITRGNVHIVINADAAFREEHDRPLDPQVWAALVDDIGSVSGIPPIPDGFACGDSKESSLTIVDEGAVVLDVKTTDCIDEGSAALDRFIARVIDAIPDWEQLMLDD
jgi:hypothetical protein